MLYDSTPVRFLEKSNSDTERTVVTMGSGEEGSGTGSVLQDEKGLGDWFHNDIMYLPLLDCTLTNG